MNKKILIYNSGGGLGDSIQLFPIILSLQEHFKHSKLYYLGSHINHFDHKLKEYNKTDMVSIMKPGTCVLMEILLRYFTDFDNTKNGSKYFFDLESARINDIPSLRI